MQVMFRPRAASPLRCVFRDCNAWNTAGTTLREWRSSLRAWGMQWCARRPEGSPISSKAWNVTRCRPRRPPPGHTSWATNGAPSDVNAHPHPPAYAGRGDIAVRRDYGHADGPAPRVRAGIHGAVDLQHAGGVDTARIRCRQIIDSLKGMPAKIQWVLDTQAGTAR